MSTQALRQAAGIAQQQQTQDQGFPGMLMKFKDQLATALPKHLNADRMARVALTAFRQNPGLAQCDPKSIFAACVISAQLGLEIGVLGHAYLVPYAKNSKDANGNWQKTWECQLIPGWRGLVDLLARAGRASVWTGAVFNGDEFDYGVGDRPYINHKPGEEFAEDKLTHVYAVGRVKGQEYPVVTVWPIAKVKKHRDRFNKVGNSHYSFQHFEMYARKVVLLQTLKMLPLSIEMASAYELDQAAETGSQGLTIEGAVNGDFSPVPSTPPPTAHSEAFDILGWNAEERAKFIADHADQTGEQIAATLSAEIDRMQEAR